MSSGSAQQLKRYAAAGRKRENLSVIQSLQTYAEEVRED